MGTLWISGFSSFGYATPGAPPLPPRENLSAGLTTAASTLAVGANTNLIEVWSDVGAYLNVGSSGSTVVATSTNSIWIPPNQVPRRYAIAPYSKLTAIST